MADDELATPFHTFDHHGNEYVVVHDNVPIDAPAECVLWPVVMWEAALRASKEPSDGR